MEMDPNIKNFLSDLIVAKGGQPSDDEIEKIYPSLEEHLVMAVLEALPEEKQGDFQHELEEGDMSPEQVQQYVVQHVPNYQQVFLKAFEDFKQAYLQS